MPIERKPVIADKNCVFVISQVIVSIRFLIIFSDEFESFHN